MVYYYSSNGYTIISARDSAEQTALLQHARPTDVSIRSEGGGAVAVFARANEISSEPGSIDDVPADVIAVGANLSRESSKTKKKPASINVVYTLCSNLKIGASNTANPTDPAGVRTRSVRADPETLQKLLRTKTEKFPDLEAELLDYEKEVRKRNTDAYHQNRNEDRITTKQYRELAEAKARGYSDLYNEETLAQSSNQNRSEDWEDDFM